VTRAGLDVLYEDNMCIVVNKPADVLVQGGTRDPTLRDRVCDYLGRRYGKPGKVFLGVVHRLDGPVTGVVLFARNSKAARRLCEQFREGRVVKTYWAFVAGRFPEPTGTLRDHLLHDTQCRQARVVTPDTPGAKEAVTVFRCLTHSRHGTLMELQPRTGRYRQLRIQLASRGFPIWGDRAFGSAERLSPGIALHARSITFDHPVRHEPVHVSADLPASWSALPGGHPTS